jgi:translation initiation factor 6 (eIF-6)
MIQEYAADLAAQMGIKLSRISVMEGRNVGCLDAYLLHLGTNGRLVSALVYQSELDNLKSGFDCDQLEVKIRAALSRLNMLLRP